MIIRFFRDHLEDKCEASQFQVPLDELNTSIRSVFIQELGVRIVP